MEFCLDTCGAPYHDGVVPVGTDIGFAILLARRGLIETCAVVVADEMEFEKVGILTNDEVGMPGGKRKWE